MDTYSELVLASYSYKPYLELHGVRGTEWSWRQKKSLRRGKTFRKKTKQKQTNKKKQNNSNNKMNIGMTNLAHWSKSVGFKLFKINAKLFWNYIAFRFIKDIVYRKLLIASTSSLEPILSWSNLILNFNVYFFY